MEEMEETFRDIEEAEETVDLVQDVYTYLTEHHYPPHCKEAGKRAIWRKAKRFVICDGELFFLKQKKNARNGKKVLKSINYCIHSIYEVTSALIFEWFCCDKFLPDRNGSPGPFSSHFHVFILH